MTKKQRDNDDVFAKVTRRKKDIVKLEKKEDKRLRKLAAAKNLEERCKNDPILRAEVAARKKAGNPFGSQASRRKVLARSEKLGFVPNFHDESPIIDRKMFNQLRKRNFIVASTKPAYHCPCCGICKTKLSEWFVSAKVNISELPFDPMMNRRPARKVMCRSCVIAFGWEGKPVMKNYKLWTEIVRSYKVNAIDLCRKRKMAGYSVQSFAETVGWMSSYQYRLENGQILRLNAEAMCDLVAALHRVGEEASCDMWGAAEQRFIIDGSAIQKMRTCSQTQFAKNAGWSKAYQNKLENGKIISVDKRTMNLISQQIPPFLPA